MHVLGSLISGACLDFAPRAKKAKIAAFKSAP